MKKITICIPIKTRAEGGGNYFIDNFRNYLRRHNISFHDNLRLAHDILFTNHWIVPYWKIYLAKCRFPYLKVVQRIDGAAQDYGRMSEADIRQSRVNKITDLTIFQSQYCRYSTRVKFPVIRQDGLVIYNPVDINNFRPEGESYNLPGKKRVCHVTWSTNPKKGISSVYTLAQQHHDVSFFLCGRYENPPSLPNVHLMGFLDRIKLAKVLRSCHALVTFSENEACSNVVLESLACGLPVLYKDSGSMREIVGPWGLAIERKTFSEKLEVILSCSEEMKKGAREWVLECYHPDVIFPKYMKAIYSKLKEKRTFSPMSGLFDGMKDFLGHAKNSILNEGIQRK